MSDQVAASDQRLGDDMRDTVGVTLHIRRRRPLAINKTLLVDGKPLQVGQVGRRDAGAVIVRARGHVHRQRAAVVRPRGVVAGADGAAGGDGGIGSGGRAGVVADALDGADARLRVPRVPFALDQVCALLDPLVCATLDAGTASGKGLVTE